ncbi:hypothetical protein CDL12_00135 [Handroanthus impetiginosus]|uniref:Uncharacterized protein n=1 Tax=Handroanthus impetiginosus TaxID=429701 RepID=A0A2G9IBF5_9LAMI|nr:hypothetical protein CDL12_00135 [Handroanthus impetiginosus]
MNCWHQSYVSVGRGEKGLGVYMREARRSTSFKYTTWILAMQCSWTLMSIRMNHPFRVVFGVLTDRPFGLPRKSRSFFWKPIFKEKNEKITKVSSFSFQKTNKIISTSFKRKEKMGSKMGSKKMNTELCLESTKEECLESTKGDYNNEGKQERIHNSNNEGKQEKINKKKKNRIPFISTIKKTLDSLSKNQIISYLFSNLSCLSQAYVFYKLSYQLSNSPKYVLQDQGSPFLLKPEIKALLKHKEWVIRRGIAENENFSKCYSKDQLIDLKKQKQFEVYSLSNQKENFQKNYRYDLLSYQFLNFENKRECCFYRSPFQGNTNQEISYKTADRKYFDRKILNFDLRQKVGSKALITIDTNRNQKTQIRNQKTQIRTNNSFRIPKKDLLIPDKKDLLIPEINPPNSDKEFFEWNKEL